MAKRKTEQLLSELNQDLERWEKRIQELEKENEELRARPVTIHISLPPGWENRNIKIVTDTAPSVEPSDRPKEPEPAPSESEHDEEDEFITPEKIWDMKKNQTVEQMIQSKKRLGGKWCFRVAIPLDDPRRKKPCRNEHFCMTKEAPINWVCEGMRISGKNCDRTMCEVCKTLSPTCAKCHYDDLQLADPEGMAEILEDFEDSDRESEDDDEEEEENQQDDSNSQEEAEMTEDESDKSKQRQIPDPIAQKCRKIPEFFTTKKA